MELLIVILVVGAVAFVLSAPLRRAPAASDEDGDAARGDMDELEVARDAKYREIREAELDYRTGKLSEADWRALDAGLRSDAIEILRALDRAAGRSKTA